MEKQSRHSACLRSFVLTTAAAGSFAIIRLPLPLIAKMLIIQTTRLFFRLGGANRKYPDPRVQRELSQRQVLLSLMPGCDGGVASGISLLLLSEIMCHNPDAYRLRTLADPAGDLAPMLATMWFWPNWVAVALLLVPRQCSSSCGTGMLCKSQANPKCAASRTIPDNMVGLVFRFTIRDVLWLTVGCRASGSHS